MNTTDRDNFDEGKNVVDFSKFKENQHKLNNFERYLKALPVSELFNEIKKLIEEIEYSPLSHEIIKKAEILLNEFDYRIHLNMPNVSQQGSEALKLPKINFEKIFLDKKFSENQSNPTV